MIQKNADSLELLRGKSGRVFGLMCGVNMSIKVRFLPKSWNSQITKHTKGAPNNLQRKLPPHTNSVNPTKIVQNIGVVH